MFGCTLLGILPFVPLRSGIENVGSDKKTVSSLQYSGKY
jgi:hypothetical protein